MARGPRNLTLEEKRLWRRVTAQDKPLRPIDDLEDVTEPAAPNAAASKPVVVKKPAPHADKAAKPIPAGAHNFGQERKVRRGQIEVEGRLDLHGMTQQAAQSALANFLNAARRDRKRCVLVITGKGSAEPTWPHPQRGVLRRRLPEWLDGLARDGLVSGFASAHRTHGGDGAYYVFLKTR
ncbi:MAG: Smr/MutS family protein [Caulobacterales bacterium]